MITVVGEALVDLLISPDGTVEAALGGGPFNTARACGRLGADVEFVGALSTDRFGRLLAQRLDDDGVSAAAAPRVEAPTTLAAAELDAAGTASYRFYVEGTSAPALTSVPDCGGIWYTGGLGLVLEPMASVLAGALAARSPGRGLVMVDVNCRPEIIADRDRYVERVGRVVAATDVVKVSEEDLGYLVPGAAPLDGGRRLLAGGPRVVLLTRGAGGVHVLTAGGERFVPAEQTRVVDTVGAGDAFGAGFLVAWTEVGDVRALADLDRLVAAAGFGARVAAAVVGRRGAHPPWRHEIDES